MRNFTGEHLHVIENVGCRCKICKGSIFKSQKRQDADAIVHDRQAEKHLQVQRKASCRYIGQEKSICNSEYQGIADTSATKRASAITNTKGLQIQRLQKNHLPVSITVHHRALLFNSLDLR